MTQESSKSHFGALHEIRDRAYLLSLGNVYLCEAVFLVKIGKEIEALLETFGEEIIFIKKRFPGQMASDVDMGTVVEDIRSLAQDLKNPDAGLDDKCTAGELGRELEKSVEALTSAVKMLIAKVEGELPEYSKKDAVLDALGAAKTPARAVSSTIALILKGIILLLLLALGPLAYLVLTMDTEVDLRKEIGKSQTQISSVKERMASLEQERKGIINEIEALKADNPVREDRIAAIDLNMRVHNLEDKLAQAEVELANLEEITERKLARIEEIRNKSFLQRLFDR
jgi:hypothetical protein